MIPASIALVSITRDEFPRLSMLAGTLCVLGSTMAIGQFALDYATLAIATNDSGVVGNKISTAIRDNPFVRLVFIEAPFLLMVGIIILAGMLVKLRDWRVQGVMLIATIISFFVLRQFLGSNGERIATGGLWVTYTYIAVKAYSRTCPRK